MTLAWFRPSTLTRGARAGDEADPLDETACLVAELRSAHEIDVFTGATAHDFVWKHVRTPYELCVFELDNTLRHAFIWPYLLQYGGIVFLRALTLHDSRADALAREGRRHDYAAEFAFNEGHPPSRPSVPPYYYPGTWPMLRIPLLASRAVVVPHRGMAAALQAEYPEARIRHAPLGVRQVQDTPRVQQGPDSSVAFGVPSTGRVDVARRALARALDEGAAATLLVDGPERVLHDADVVVALTWPSVGEPQTLALAAMAAGKPVIAGETGLTADWPALNPQTWQPRPFTPGTPIAVSIDLRDEEHSLAVAMRRLSLDHALRARLGDAARTWWRTHATARVAADAWERILREAVPVDRPPRPADWPAHLHADGTERARAMLEELGVSVDLF